VTEGEVVPYASWYETGFLMDRPLVQLRSDLVRLGFARQEGVREPEDHAAALCEVMGMLILKAQGSDADAMVRYFFQTHLADWMPSFFADLRRAPSAVLYAAVGDLGEQILELERRYLSLTSDPVGTGAYPPPKQQEPSER
jgi:TorA maturation chaperone TorD